MASACDMRLWLLAGAHPVFTFLKSVLGPGAADAADWNFNKVCSALPSQHSATLLLRPLNECSYEADGLHDIDISVKQALSDFAEPCHKGCRKDCQRRGCAWRPRF